MSVWLRSLVTQDVQNFTTARQQTRRKELFNGRTKILFDGPEPGTLVLY